MKHELTTEQQSRREKLQHLRDAEIDPYPHSGKRTHTNKEALEQYEALASNEQEISLVGRIKLLRPHGKSTFAQIEDESSALQFYFRQDILGEKLYTLMRELDLGDFIEAHGKLFTTKMGEQTLQVHNWRVLTKSLRPLPEKWHGLKDLETRYRKRYIDLLMNAEKRELFRKRSTFIKSIRSFLDENGFMEVETPILELVPGGAEAEPFITHHNTLDIDLYLRISLELHHKRLIVGGYEKIFEIGKVFRNEGMSTQHLQEFTMLEFYWAYANWEDMMAMIEQLTSTVVEKTFGTLQIPFGNTVLDFTPPFPRVNYVEIVKEKTGIDIETHTDAESLRKAILQQHIELEQFNVGRGRLIDQLYKKRVRPELVRPQFLINHPVDVSPLSKRDPKNPQRTERFQLLVNTAEVVNGFSELNDPIDQRERFETQAGLREHGDSEAYMFDEDFVQAIEHGLPPTAGVGIGIDRLFMILANQESIRDVVFFPTMKPL